jgi:hypothetical protein
MPAKAGGRLRGPVLESLTKAGLCLNAIGAGKLKLTRLSPGQQQ